MPQNIIQLEKLQVIDLSGNDFIYLPDYFNNFLELQSVDLSSNNNLKVIPQSIGKLHNLRKMDVSFCKLFTLPHEIKNLTLLKELDLSNNIIEIIPDEIKDLLNLEILDLSCNKLIVLNKSICNLTNLTTLNIKENHIKNLPSDIENLVKLEYLYLDDNELIEYPIELVDLLKLKSIYELEDEISNPLDNQSDTRTMQLVELREFLKKEKEKNDIEIEKQNIIAQTIRTIELIQRKPLKFVTQNNFTEDDIRTLFYYCFGINFNISAEELSKEGRSDLMIKMDKGYKIFEFKIWKRKGYETIIKQLCGYLTNFEKFGFIIMINNNKYSIKEKYFEFVKSQQMNYIDDSYKEEIMMNYDFQITKHRFDDKIKSVYHFILDIHTINEKSTHNITLV